MPSWKEFREAWAESGQGENLGQFVCSISIRLLGREQALWRATSTERVRVPPPLD